MAWELIDPILDERWTSLASQSPAATVFHHAAWVRLLREQYGYELSACCVTRDRDLPSGGMPIAAVRSPLTGSRLVALPFSDVCPPLVASSAPASTVAELSSAMEAERRRRNVILEVRAAMPDIPEAIVSPRFHLHVVPLEDDFVAVERRFTSQARRGVAKARRLGLSVERRTDAGALESFYALHVRTRRHLGVPTQPKRFITRLAELFSRGLGFVALVRADRDVAAAAVFLRMGANLTYKYGASDRRLLASRPNNLLFAETIRWACENGCRRLDLGRTDLGQEGLRAFKRSWGAEESDLAYTYVGGAPPSIAPSRAQRAMSTVIKKAPPMVGRGLGEALYRHFG